MGDGAQGDFCVCVVVLFFRIILQDIALFQDISAIYFSSLLRSDSAIPMAVHLLFDFILTCTGMFANKRITFKLDLAPGA